MSVEWDEGLAKRLEGFAALKDNEFYCDKPEVVFAALLLAEHAARLEAEAERDEFAKAVSWLVGKDWPDHPGDTVTEKALDAVVERQGQEIHHLSTERDALAEKVEAAKKFLHWYWILDDCGRTHTDDNGECYAETSEYFEEARDAFAAILSDQEGRE